MAGSDREWAARPAGDREIPERPPCKGPNCGTTTFKHSRECIEAHDISATEPPEEDDFLAGVQACDRFDPTCESCQ